MLNKIVLASHNAGKLQEFNQLLAPLQYQLLPQAQLGVSDVDEPHPTFIENCLTKARNAAQITGLPALADDSGLCVAALNGAPGVRSARYAGDSNATTRDASNNARLIATLQGHGHRQAWYYCALVYLRHANDPQPLIAEGIWHGSIIDTPRGAGGFGYDAHFYLPDLDKTAAELSTADKNRFSHRGLAMQALLRRLSSP